MKTIYLSLLLSLCVFSARPQTPEDIFRHEVPVTWLGIDFSHVTLIGNFAEFGEIGAKGPVQIITDYFPKWNHIVLNEREKYDIRGMLRRRDIEYDIDMVMELNYRTNPDSLESYNARRFTPEEIQSFVNEYYIKGREGIGVVFIAESLNKCYEEAFYHFVAINMKTGEVILHERLRGEPSGFGLRNYWANSIYRVIRNIKYYYFAVWKGEITGEETVSAFELHVYW
ncbi:MAG: hypothetical protein JXR41_08230 [Bacteroidales bacterium]|nr:hypothetical protein [Bacteroidales bacterium]MBN2763061.1 hypothetical protein [Bacteroidales bacterium]